MNLPKALVDYQVQLTQLLNILQCDKLFCPEEADEYETLNWNQQREKLPSTCF